MISGTLVVLSDQLGSWGAGTGDHIFGHQHDTATVLGSFKAYLHVQSVSRSGMN